MREDSIIVFLEDDPKRAALNFQRMNKKDQQRTFWVKTVVETIDLLKDYRERLDIVSLGYDLSGEGYSHPASETCGMEVIRWLEKQNPLKYSHVYFIIHTWNIFIGKKMMYRLKEKGYKAVQIPFGL